MSIKKSLKSMFTRLPLPEDEDKRVPSSYEIPDRIPYDIISHKLCRAMDANKDVIGDRILIPNYYKLFFNEEDRESRKHSEGIMIDELKKNMLKEAKKLNKNVTEEDFNLEIFSDDSLDKGRIKIQCYFKEQQVEDQSGGAIEFTILQEEEKAGVDEEIEEKFEEAVEMENVEELQDDDEPVEDVSDESSENEADISAETVEEEVTLEEALESIESDSDDVIVVEEETDTEEVSEAEDSEVVFKDEITAEQDADTEQDVEEDPEQIDNEDEEADKEPEEVQVAEAEAGEEVDSGEEKAAMIIEVFDGSETTKYDVIKNELIIGRSDKADIILPEPDEKPKISRQHAILIFSDDKIEIIPKGSNGTWLNDEELELENTYPVEIDDVIKIKDYQIKITQRK
ncbi:MAG: DUF3662 domain-containing protein [bacterium]|nr:DUF3662 domain-containing protein [bacterium]